MSQFYSPRGKGKIVTERELEAKKDRKESSHQLAFCKWLHSEYPEVKFRSDIQSAGKLSPQMQNIKLILDPFDSWPDIAIYLNRGKYCGLQIEMKRENSGLYLKDGSLSKSVHVQDQNKMHDFLRSIGWAVCFAEGVEKAKELFVKYYKL